MTGLRPPRGYLKKDTQRRNEWLEEKTGFHYNELVLDEPENLKGIIENHVGFIPIPMAIAGPARIKGTYAKGEFYVPLCTLEGTLSISMTRGFYLTHKSNGIETQHIKQELSRSPLFAFDDIKKTTILHQWVDQNYDEIKKVAESTTSHGKLLRIDKYPIQNCLILDFVYSTGEAAGQNMTTIATHEACKFIKAQFFSIHKFSYQYYIECNFNCDKNPASRTLLNGRGHHVIASALVRGELLKRVLRCSADDIIAGWAHSSPASRMAGILGDNMHVSNALAALYLATGQDVACVAENSAGIVSYEKRDGKDLQMFLSMPSISVGTVGGGTRLKQQRKNLEMLGCTGPDSSKKLAEIVCASALALELSLIGAIRSDEFSQSHANYGRQ